MFTASGAVGEIRWRIQQRNELAIGDVQQVIETAIGETTLTTTIEGRRRFPVRVRYAPQYRADPQMLSQVLVASPQGSQIPLGQLARIEHARGPAMISSENGLLLATVLLNVQGRDVGGFVEEARQRVAHEVTLPSGYYIGWSGRWENQEHARQRLLIVVPIAEPKSSCSPPLIVVPVAVAPASTSCSPPLMVVSLALAPNERNCTPLLIVVVVAVPPEPTCCMPPLITVRLAVAPPSTNCSPPVVIVVLIAVPSSS